MLPWSGELAGRLDEHVIASELLRDNPLGDPCERPLWVYLPPGYDDEPGRRYPVGVRDPGLHRAPGDVAQPGALPAAVHRDRRRGVRRGEAPPAIVVYVDAWTAYGGSQFVDSPGTGRYHSYLCDEVVPWVDGRYRTLAARGAPGDHGQVERRVRRDDHPDAAARPVRGAGHPRRRRAVRAVLHPGVRPGGAAPARLRRRHLAVVGRLPLPDLVHQGGRPRPARAARRGGLLLGRTRRRRWSCRSTRGPACCGPRSGSAGWTGTRSGWSPGTPGALRSLRGDLDRRGHQGRLLPGPRRGGVPARRCARSASPTK